jgi:hypothetical protein
MRFDVVNRVLYATGGFVAGALQQSQQLPQARLQVDRSTALPMGQQGLGHEAAALHELLEFFRCQLRHAGAQALPLL